MNIIKRSTNFLGNFASDPSTGVAGQFYYNTGSNSYLYYNGSAWTALGGGFSGTQGSVPFADTDGSLTEDNANFSWNNANKRLTIKTAENTVGLVVESSGTPFYYPKIQLKQGSNSAYIMGEYDGDLLLTATTAKYIKFGVQGVASTVRINPYPFGTNSAPNDEITRITSGTATDKLLKLIKHASQSVNLFELLASDGTTIISAFDKDGAWHPPTLADSSAENNTVYYSSDASKLVYKDSGGSVNALY